MNTDFENILEEEGDYQIESELYELRKKYLELKEERKKVAQESQLIENKVKLLQIEDVKVDKKEEKEKQQELEKQIIKSRIKQDKERLQKYKAKQDIELKQKKTQITVMKDNIKNVNTNWKTNLSEKNKSEVEKLKMIREENEKFVNSLKQEDEERNKQQCIQIKSQLINSSEKRKKIEFDRKLKMKQMLEAKINEELNAKSTFEDKIGKLEEQENNILEKRKETGKSNLSHSSKGK